MERFPYVVYRAKSIRRMRHIKVVLDSSIATLCPDISQTAEETSPKGREKGTRRSEIRQKKNRLLSGVTSVNCSQASLEWSMSKQKVVAFISSVNKYEQGS